MVRTTTITGSAPSATITGLTNGTAYNFRVRAVNAVGTSGLSAASNTVTPTAGTTAAVPGAPVIGIARQGGAGGAVNARAVWSAPASNGGSPLTNYRVNAYRVNANGTTTIVSQTTVGATVTSRSIALPAGNYQFDVMAVNAVGNSVLSARSNTVAAR